MKLRMGAMLRGRLRPGVPHVKCFLIFPPGLRLLLYLYQPGPWIASERKNSVNWLKRKINVLTHISKMFTGESAFDRRCSWNVRNLFPPTPSLPLPHPTPPVLTLPCLGLILNQALLAGSIRAGIALGTHPSPSATSYKK